MIAAENGNLAVVKKLAEEDEKVKFKNVDENFVS